MPGDNVGVMPGDNTRMPIEDVFLQAKKAFSDHVPKGSALQAKQIVFS